MTHTTRNQGVFRHAASKGFTLIEAIIVLVVLSIAAVTVVQLAGTILNSQADNKTLQVGMQLMQECAEHVLATRRTSGYSVTPSCSNLTAFTGFDAPTVTTDPYTGTACPSGGTCKLVAISVAPTSGGGSMTPITVLLVGP